MRESGSMTWQMGSAPSQIFKGIATKATGSKTSIMDRALKIGKMALNMRASITLAGSTVEVG